MYENQLILFNGKTIKWVEFVVGSRPCSQRFFSGYSGFQKPTLLNFKSISKVSPISALC